MRIFAWDDKYSTGEIEVDAQHRELLNSLRELQLELYKEVHIDILLDKIHELQEYCLKHFALEQELMEPFKHSLPMYEAHIKHHAHFVERTCTFAQRVEDEGVHIAKELCQFISDWLAKHITDMDIKTFKALKEIKNKG